MTYCAICGHARTGDVSRDCWCGKARTTALSMDTARRVSLLNPDELAVIESALSDLLDGLEKGRALYGPLDLATNERDFLREAREEQRDGMLYTAMESVKQGRVR